MSAPPTGDVAVADALPTRSLRVRVIVGVLVVLAVVLVAAGVLIESLLGSQLRGDLQQRLVDRVSYGALLDKSGYTGGSLASALTTRDGVVVTFVPSDGGSPVTGVAPSNDVGPPGPPAPRAPRPSPPADFTYAVSSDAGGIQVSTAVTGGRIVAQGSTFDITQTLNRLRTIELIAGLATLVVVGLLLTRVVTVALRPLSSMTDLARRIAHGGRGGRLRPDRPRTELGRTATAFDEMLASLETAERDAHRAAAEAIAAEERMRRLLADVSHELRTPVATLQARAETLLRENPSRDRREELAVGMIRDTRRAARLVDDLLLMNRLEQAPTAQLARRRVDVGELVTAVIAGGEVLDHSGQVAVHSATNVLVDADAGRLGQVVSNLVANARRAAGPAGRVSVGVQAAEGWAVVTVTDDGPGVPAADRERIFDRFVRLDAARSHDTGGSGLGLPIARAIARAHGGDVVGVDVPTGARFVVTVPLAVGPGAVGPGAVGAGQRGAAGGALPPGPAGASAVPPLPSLAPVPSSLAPRGPAGGVGTSPPFGPAPGPPPPGPSVGSTPLDGAPPASEAPLVGSSDGRPDPVVTDGPADGVDDPEPDVVVTTDDAAGRFVAAPTA